MITDYFHLALAEEILHDYKLTQKKAQWTQVCQNNSRDDFIADAKRNFLDVYAALFKKSMLKTKNLTIQIKIAVPKCTACAAKRIGAIIERLIFSNLVAQCSTKELLTVLVIYPCVNFTQFLHKAEI